MTDPYWDLFGLCLIELTAMVVTGFLALYYRGQLINAKRANHILQGTLLGVARILGEDIEQAPRHQWHRAGAERKNHTDMLGGPGA